MDFKILLNKYINEPQNMLPGTDPEKYWLTSLAYLYSLSSEKEPTIDKTDLQTCPCISLQIIIIANYIADKFGYTQEMRSIVKTRIVTDSLDFKMERYQQSYPFSHKTFESLYYVDGTSIIKATQVDTINNYKIREGLNHGIDIIDNNLVILKVDTIPIAKVYYKGEEVSGINIMLTFNGQYGEYSIPYLAYKKYMNVCMVYRELLDTELLGGLAFKTGFRERNIETVNIEASTDFVYVSKLNILSMQDELINLYILITKAFEIYNRIQHKHEEDEMSVNILFREVIQCYPVSNVERISKLYRQFITNIFNHVIYENKIGTYNMIEPILLYGLKTVPLTVNEEIMRANEGSFSSEVIANARYQNLFVNKIAYTSLFPSLNIVKYSNKLFNNEVLMELANLQHTLKDLKSKSDLLDSFPSLPTYKNIVNSENLDNFIFTNRVGICASMFLGVRIDKKYLSTFSTNRSLSICINAFWTLEMCIKNGIYVTDLNIYNILYHDLMSVATRCGYVYSEKAPMTYISFTLADRKKIYIENHFEKFTFIDLGKSFVENPVFGGKEIVNRFSSSKNIAEFCREELVGALSYFFDADDKVLEFLESIDFKSNLFDSFDQSLVLSEDELSNDLIISEQYFDNPAMAYDFYDRKSVRKLLDDSSVELIDDFSLSNFMDYSDFKL